ncbi:hypothetical protein E4184_13450 [Aeromonas media]|uniref:Uncharacterized protein n=1 Tax=Aeromonas media TaxID=651 RepID=A0A6M4YGH8_AERME|nr:hypothetical protein E4184_13450 [Aeromonas media]
MKKVLITVFALTMAGTASAALPQLNYECPGKIQMHSDEGQGESVNILLNFTQFFETRIEYRFQIFTAHSCDFLLPSYARLA